MCITSLSNFWRCKMFEVTKDEEFVSVTVKLKKRVMARDKKIYVYAKDALREAKRVFPELDLTVSNHNSVASTVKAPHEVTWKFKIIKKPEPVQQPRLTRKQRREALAELTQLTEEAGGYEQELSTENREKPDLTEAETCDKVDEAEEKAE